MSRFFIPGSWRPRSGRRHRGDSPRRSALAASALLLAWIAPLAPTAAVAESRILLPMRGGLQDVQATTFDDKGRPVGLSSFTVETLETGQRRMRIEMAVDDGGINRSEALLTTVESGGDGADQTGGSEPRKGLRLLEERSQATRADGISLDLLVIDHVKGRASCYPADDEDLSRGKHVELPEDERIVNVPMQLLFQPLAAREVDEVHFQITLCRDGPVIHDMIAVRGPRRRHEGREIVEIRYGPDLGRTVAWLASRLLPSFSFWFDQETGQYLAHRMPLHTKGPEILLVREGLAPPDIGIR